MILDIHTHKLPPYPEGVVSLRNFEGALMSNQLYSVGIHPWDTESTVDESFMSKLEELASMPQVVMIGECGVDVGKGGPMFRQLQILKRQIDLSEKFKKPLLLHCVKAADIILGLKKDLQPKQPWIIHGFRGKPSLMRQLTDKGLFLSFGEKFNPDTVNQMPGDKILAETDDSILTIQEIIGALSEAANRDLLVNIRQNVAALLPE